MSIYDLTYKNTQLKALYREAFNIDVYGFWKFQQLQKIEPSIFITLIDIIYYQNPRKLSCVCSLIHGVDRRYFHNCSHQQKGASTG